MSKASSLPVRTILAVAAFVLPAASVAAAAPSPELVASEAVAVFGELCAPSEPSFPVSVAAAEKKGLKSLDDKARSQVGIPTLAKGGADYIWRFESKGIAFEAFALKTGEENFGEQCGVSFSGTTDAILLNEVLKIVPPTSGTTIQPAPDGARSFVDIPHPRWRSIRMSLPDASGTDLTAVRKLGAAARTPLK